MDKSQFAAVVFDQVAEFYPTDINVQCSYTLSSSIEPKEEDWVGLYKVGWTRQSNYLCYQPAGLVTDGSEEGQSSIGSNRRGWAVFPANELPKEDGEFYQFCYVSDRHGISGASTPFQFRKASAAEFVEIEEDDMLVVRPQIDVLREKIQDLEEKKLALVEERQKLTSRVEALEKKALKHESVIENLQQALQDSRQSEKDLVLARDGLSARLEEMEAESHEIFKEKEAYVEQLAAANSKLEELRETISTLESTVLALRSQVKSLQSEKDELSGENQSLLEQVNSYKDQVTESQNLAARCEKEVEGLNEKLQSADIEYASQKQLLMQEMERESQAHSKILHKKEEQLRELESKNLRLERCCGDLQNEFDNAKDKLHALEAVISEMGKNLKDSEETKRRLHEYMEERLPQTRQQLDLVTAELQKVQSEKYALTVRLEDFEQGFKDTIATKDREVAAMTAKLQEMTHQLHRANQELQQERERVLEAGMAKSLVTAERFAMACEVRNAQDKLRTNVAVKDQELELNAKKLQAVTDKLREARERIWQYEEASELFDKKVEQFNLTRSYDEAYQRGLEEERLKQTKINQDLEVAMFILQDTNDCLTARLQAREEELNDLLAVKMKQEGQMAAQGLLIEDLNKRLEMGKLEYRTLMKKHQSLLHRQNMEEEFGCQSSASGEGSDHGQADHGKQKYKQLYRQERLEKDRCLEELARKEATIKSTEAQLREQEKKTRELTEQSRRLTKCVSTREKQIETLQKKLDDLLSMKVVKEHSGASMGSQTPSSIPEASHSEEEEDGTERRERDEAPKSAELQHRNPFMEAAAEEETEEPVRVELHYKNPYSSGAAAAEAAGGVDQNTLDKAKEHKEDGGKKWGLLRMFDMVPWTAEEVDGSDLQEDGNPQGVSELSSPLHPEVTPGAKVAAVKHLLARPSAEEPEVYQDCNPFFPDQMDERFMDAMGEGMKICPHCQASIFALSGFEEHVATHFGRICPICKSQADNDMSSDDFERHVNMCCEQEAKEVIGEEDARQ